jgi:chemotaxis protein CheX
MNKKDSVQSVFSAVEQVFNNMFQEKVKKGTVEKKEKVITDKVTVSIGVTGEIQGNILFSFPQQMSLDLVERMSRMKVEELDKFVASAIGELANIISGHTATALSEQGYQCDIVPPQIITGDNQMITMDNTEIILLPVITEKHNFKINISLKNN